MISVSLCPLKTAARFPVSRSKLRAGIKLTFTNISLLFQELHTYGDDIEEWDDVITIATAFSPLQMDTMTKDMHESSVSMTLFSSKCFRNGISADK